MEVPSLQGSDLGSLQPAPASDSPPPREGEVEVEDPAEAGTEDRDETLRSDTGAGVGENVDTET